MKLNKQQQFLLDDFLDFNKIQNNIFVIQKSHFLLDSAVQEVIEIQKMHAEQTETELFVSNHLHCQSIFNDQQRFQQILMNLLSNAIKHTRKGKIQVQLEDFDEYSIVVKVTDNGSGFGREA